MLVAWRMSKKEVGIQKDKKDHWFYIKINGSAIGSFDQFAICIQKDQKDQKVYLY